MGTTLLIMKRCLKKDVLFFYRAPKNIWKYRRILNE